MSRLTSEYSFVKWVEPNPIRQFCRACYIPHREIRTHARPNCAPISQAQRFTNAFGTPNRLNRRSICSSNRRVPLMSYYGREFEWETQDFANTKFILNFGANPMEAYQGGLFQVKRLMDARVKHGAKLVTFEVRPSATASISTP